MRVTIVFGRYPEVGKVKTRLGGSLNSDEAACEFYKACAEHVLAQVDNSKAVFFFADAHDEGRVREWLAASGLGGVETRPQLQVADLGARMHAAFVLAFDELVSGSKGGACHSGNVLCMLKTRATRAVVIGTDVPDLSGDIVATAFAALDEHDAVIGDSGDGGYYLLGLRKPNQSLFQRVQYSTGSVLQSTVQRAQQAGLGLAPLPTLPVALDIDFAHDMRRWVDQQHQAPGRVPPHPLLRLCEATLRDHPPPQEGARG